MAYGARLGLAASGGRVEESVEGGGSSAAWACGTRFSTVWGVAVAFINWTDHTGWGGSKTVLPGKINKKVIHRENLKMGDGSWEIGGGF